MILDLLRCASLLLVAAAGFGVVMTRDAVQQAVGISCFGLLMALTFFLYQAPDVALSQIVVGAVALPLMILLTLAKARRDREARRASRGAPEERAR
jgi:uncharacterized MnhB-related membrane protein